MSLVDLNPHYVLTSNSDLSPNPLGQSMLRLLDLLDTLGTVVQIPAINHHDPSFICCRWIQLSS
jgi:hypothetical protein